MEGVLQKASEVNDVKVAAMNITKDKLAEAVDRLEKYVRG